MPDPNAPLTPVQTAEAKDLLCSYFAECYLLGAPFKMPTFRADRRAYPRDEVPRASERVPRRSEGTHSDPTPAEAIANIEGIVVMVPIVEIIAHKDIAAILLAMPTHLEGPLRALVIMPGATPYGAAQSLKLSQSTLYRRRDEALDWACAQLYGDRWQSTVWAAA